MNALQEFKFENALIRVITIDDTPHWVAKEVCSLLSITWNGLNTLSQLDPTDEYRETILTDSMGRPQNSLIITESGLYTLIMRSNKPEAKAFRKWVTSEVLPQIRKTGSYSVKDVSRKDLALMIIKAEEEIETRNKIIEVQGKQLIAQQPAVDAWKTFMDADGLIDMVYVAQTCGVGKNRLYRKLREEKVFHYDSEYNAVYQQYIDRGYFDVRFVPNKNVGNIPVIRCAPKGAEWIYNKFYRKQAA